jgi:hypothetical protein
MVHLVQPILLIEALLRPGADVTSLCHHLHCVATIHGIPPKELLLEVYSTGFNLNVIVFTTCWKQFFLKKVLRGIFLSITPQDGLEFFKVDNFVMVRILKYE